MAVRWCSCSSVNNEDGAEDFLRFRRRPRHGVFDSRVSADNDLGNDGCLTGGDGATSRSPVTKGDDRASGSSAERTGGEGVDGITVEGETAWRGTTTMPVSRGDEGVHVVEG